MASSSSRYYSGGSGGAPTPAPTPSSPPPTAAPGGAGGGAFPFSSPGGLVASPAGVAAIAAASHFHQHGNPTDRQQQFHRPRRKRRRRRSTLSDGSRPGFGGMAGLHPRVPHNLDLTYVTDRIIGMSAPAMTTRPGGEESTTAAGPIPVPRAVPQSPAAASSAVRAVPQSPAEGGDAPPPQPQPQPPQRPVPQSPAVADANSPPDSIGASTSGEPPPQQPPRKTSSLAAAVAASGSRSGSAADAAAGPAEAPGPPPPRSPKNRPRPENSQAQQQSPPREEPSSDSTAAASATALTPASALTSESTSTTSADAARSPRSGQAVSRERQQRPGMMTIATAQRPHGNPCDELKRFLSRNHDPGGGSAGNFLAVNVSDEPIRPTDNFEAFDAFGGQVINVGWVSPARGRGCQNPSVVHLSRICYAMHAFLSLGGGAGDRDDVYHRGRIKKDRGGGGHRGGFGLGLLGEFLDGATSASPGPPRITPSSSLDDFAPPSTAGGRGGGGVVAVYCSNGKTRTGIVIACYLKYSGVVPSTLAGFHLFCRRRACIPNNVPVSEYVPPSLRQFFANFDDVVELGGFANPEPLYLRAITVQGLPVDDAPAVDVWDVSGGHVYSSHPIAINAGEGAGAEGVDEDLEGKTAEGKTAGKGQWADEEGFYRVDAILHGDFALTCRFGGRYASDVTDPRKILFRYVNHTGCVCRGPLELPMIKVDVMRRYADDIDEDEFLVCLMFDPVPPGDDVSTGGGDGVMDGNSEARVARFKKRRRLPPILDGAEAVAMGWTLIAGTHAVSTMGGGGDYESEDDPPLARLRRLVGSDRTDGAGAADGDVSGDGEGDFVISEEACVVALKLTNLDVGRARHELVHGRLRHLWDWGGGEIDDDGDGGSTSTTSEFDRGVLSASNSLVTPAKRRRRALADSLSSEDGSRFAIVSTSDGEGDGGGPDDDDDNIVLDGAGKLDLDLALLLPAALRAELGGADDADGEASSAETARMRKVLDGIDLRDGEGGVMGAAVPGGGGRDGEGDASWARPCTDADANAHANAASVVGSVLYSPIVPPTRSDVLDAFAASDAGGRQQHVHDHHRVPFLGRVIGRPDGAAGDAHSLALALPGDDDPRDLPLLPLTRGEDGASSLSWSPASAGRRRRRISAAGDSVVRTFQGVTRGLFRSPSHRKCESHDFADDLHDAASLKRRRRGDYFGEVDDDLGDEDGVLHSLVEGGDSSTVDMLMELSHTGVTVQDLTSLARESFVDDDAGELSPSGLDDDLDVAAIIQKEEAEKRRGGDVSMADEEGIANERAVSEGDDGDKALSDHGSGSARPSDEEPGEFGSDVRQLSAATDRSSSSSLSKALASEKAKSREPPGQAKRANFSKSSSLGRALAASQRFAGETDGSVEEDSQKASSLVRSASSAVTTSVAATSGGVENREHQAPLSSLAKAAAASADTFRRRGDGTEGSRESADDSVGMSDAIAAAAAAEAAVEAAVAASAERMGPRDDDGDAENATTTSRRGRDDVGISAAKEAASAAEEAVAAVAERLLPGPEDDGGAETTAKGGEDDVGVSVARARAAAAAAIEGRRGPTEAGGDAAPTSGEDACTSSVAKAAAAAAIAKRKGEGDDGEETSLCQPTTADVADAALITQEKDSGRMDDSMPSYSMSPDVVGKEGPDDVKTAVLSATTEDVSEHAAKEERKESESSTSGKLDGFSAAKAAAAAALSKRQGMGATSGDLTTSKADDSIGMSAAKAAAAAAIAKRQGVSDEKSTATLDSPASGGFSAAQAAAAAAMAKRQGIGGVKMPAEQEAPNGLSAAKAAAAAAMLRRQGSSSTQESTQSIQPAGISAAKAAAAAAMAKRQGGADDRNSSGPSASPGGLNAAKAAAAAAMAKRQGQGDGGDRRSVKSTAPVAMSAAKAAAAAALARRQGNADDDAATKPGASGGLNAAKAAAAAALAKRQGQVDAGDKKTSKPTAPVAMSAAKAAAAAALARRQGKADDEVCSEAGSSDGISAAKAAAAAALAKKQGQVDAGDEEIVKPTAPVPMSAAKAAAAAALARRQGNADDEESTEPGASDGISAAKAAAAAAMAKRGKKGSTPTASVGMSAAKAAAAAALAKKQGGGDSTTAESPSSNGMSAAKAAAAAAMARRLGPPGSDSTDSSASPDSSSGMSAAKAAAAAAMLKRDGKATENSEPTEAAGISAARAAAAAAMAKRQGEPNELKKKPNVVGMSAAKAAAAAAMAKREAQIGDSASEPTQTPGEDLQDGCKASEQTASGTERPALKDDPEYEKYFKMLKVGLPMGAVQNALIRDGKDPAVMDGDHSKPAPLVVPLKEDPEYVKYFKMLKVGLPVGAAKNALVRDGKNPAIMDLDPDKPLTLQQLPNDDDDDDEDDVEEEGAEGGEDEVGVHGVQDGKASAEIEVPLKQDPEYEKYFRMLKMGLPMGAVQNALVRDGRDPSIMDLDPEKSLASQVKSTDDKDGPPLKEDPEYEKYFRMLKMGLPVGAVQNALVRDGKDPGIMELDPEKSLASQTKSDAVDDGPPLKEDPDYEKYFKMLKMGLPMGAVQNALVRDGKDPGIMDLDPEKSLASQMEPDADNVDDGPPLKEDPDYEKYFKMLKMGLPMGAVRNALVRDGKDPGIMDLDPDKSLSSQLKPEVADVDDGPPLKEDPDFEKYFKMLKMGLPMGAVQNALVRDGKDPGIMDLDPEKSLASQMQSNEVDDGPPLKEDPDYEKYFKMLKMGLPMGAVKNALMRDGKDPGIMDLDPDKSLAGNMTKKSVAKKEEKKSRKKKAASKEKKKKVRRKKIFWTSIDESKIDKESIWSLVQGTVPMEKLKYDTAEFENLFTETATASDKKKTEKKGSKESKPKKSVQVIDGKRGMNGGIILARLKVDFADLAKSVDMMDARNLDVTQLKALQEFLPTDEEAGGLRSYLRNASKSEEAKQAAMHDLCACEKYMVAMMDVKDAKAKFDCMLFKAQFETRRAELMDDIKTVIKACDDLRGSIRLRKLMAMILALGNQINTGGTGNVAAGFTLDALLKLNEAKAFDKKTSVLLYLVKLVKQNDADLLTFKNDILSTEAAERIMLDAISADMKQLKEELKHVNEAAEVDGDKRRLEEATIQRKLSMEELKEQKTFTRNVEGVTHFNRMVNEDDLTQMERFGREAETKMDEAFSLELEMKEKYTKLLKYFGEDEKMASSDFFGTICRFISEFDAAYEQLKKLDLAKAKEEKRRKREEERRAAKQAKEAKKAAASKKPEEDAQAKEAREAAKKAEEVVLMLGSICSGNFPTDDKTNEATVDKNSPSKEAPGKGDIASIAAQAALAKKKETDDQSSQNGEDAAPSRELSAAKAAAAAAMARRLGPQDSEDQKATGSSNLGSFSAAKAAAAAAMSNRMGKGDATIDKSPAVLDGAGGIASIAANAALARNKGGENRFDMEKPDTIGTGSSAASAVREIRGSEENGENVSVDMTRTEGGNLTCRQGSVAGDIGDKESFVDIKGIATIALSKSKETCGPDASTRKEEISESTMTPGDGLVDGKDDTRIALSSRAGASRDTAALLASSLQPNMGLLNEIENRRKARHDQLTPQDPDGPEATTVTQNGAHSECASISTNAAANEGDLTGSVHELSRPTKPVANAALDGIADGTCGGIGTGLNLDGDRGSDVGERGTNPKPKTKEDGEHSPQSEDLRDDELANTDIVVVDKNIPPEENDRAVNEPTQSRASGTHSLVENNKKPKENDVAAAQGGGISSAAAAATVEKSQQPRESIPPRASGGIAAAAAAAALKKSKHPKESGSSSSSGGLAAATATTLENDKQPKESIQPLASGGIAAEAATAALKKGKQPKESLTPPASGGIAAAAAAAALKKGKQPKESTLAPASGGIAGAAAAALKKSKQPKESNPPVASGGIAAAAAAAALKKGKQSGESSPSPSAGGIAAAAAAAALKKNKHPEESETPAAPGGIAAAAAAAALKKGKQLEGSSPPPSSGGIAAAAAAAALKKKKLPRESNPSAARGGIAAAAAAAALARTNKPEDSVSSAAIAKRNNVNVTAIPVGGIAAAAAEAALKRRVDKHCHTY